MADAEKALSLLEAAGQATSSGDQEIRRALAALSQEASRAGIGVVPWSWLAEVVRVGSSQRGTEDVGLHAVALCRWWRDISPRLTAMDSRDLGFNSLQPDATARIVEAALPVLLRREGSEQDVNAGMGHLPLGQLKRMTLELIADLAASGVHLSEVVRPWASPPRTTVDAALLSGLGKYGRGDFAPVAPGITAAPEVEMEVALRSVHNGHLFVQELAEAAAGAGGWVAVGAERAIVTVTRSNLDTPGEKALLDAAMRHLRSRRIPPVMVNGFEWRTWVDARTELEASGAPASWAVREPEPVRGSVQLQDLAPGEERHVVTLDHRPESNRFFVRRDGSEYVWEVDAARSSGDPTRVRWEQARNADLWEIYSEIGRSLQMPPSYVVDDFEPFDGVPRPDMTP